jgi:hypothetical protein
MSRRGTNATTLQRSWLLAAALAIVAPSARVVACSAFSVAGDGLVLFAVNEDFWDPDTKMWLVPASEGSYGRVYFGYSGLLPEGGMNEAGLAYDGFATPPKPVQRGREKPLISERELIDTAMASCATVEEVLALFDRHNLEVMKSFMLMFADRSGASVIIEGDHLLRKSGAFQAVTNFRQSEHPDGRGAYEGGESCVRFEIANERLAQLTRVTVEAARDVLVAIHAEGRSRTLYSVIYELGNGRAHLYHYHDFSHEVVIDLAAELEKGARVIDLPTLFPRSSAYETFAGEQAAELEKRRVGRGAATVSPDLLTRYVGRYRGPEGVLTTSVEDGRLIGDAVGLPQIALTPASPTTFYAVRFIGDVELDFRVGTEGQVQGITLRAGDHQTFMERLP